MAKETKTRYNEPLRKSDIAEAVQISQMEAAGQVGVGNYHEPNEDIAAAENTTFVIGEKVFIRTVTHHLTGEVDRLSYCFGVGFLHLKNPAWVADDGKFSDAMNKGIFKEVEPILHPIRLNVSTILDVYHWNFPLPRP